MLHISKPSLSIIDIVFLFDDQCTFNSKKSLQKERLVKLFGRLIFRPKPEHEKGGLISSLTSQLIDRYELFQV
jgi:hypothetical protein